MGTLAVGLSNLGTLSSGQYVKYNNNKVIFFSSVLPRCFQPNKTNKSAFGTLFRDASKQSISSCFPAELTENKGSKKC